MKIEELALKVAKDMNTEYPRPYWTPSKWDVDFATRFLAAYTEQQEPVAWIDAEGRIYTILPEFMKHKSEYSPIFSAGQRAEVVQQRDELLNALEIMLNFMGMDEIESNTHIFNQARAAIAKVQP